MVGYLRTGAIDELLIIERPEGGRLYAGADGIGSTALLTDEAGTTTARYFYEPFGTTTLTNPAVPNAFRFTGRELDETGLYYYRARYYSPTLARFLSEDRVNRLENYNLYRYARNNPLRWIDPFGLWDYAKEYGTIGDYLTTNMKNIEGGVDKVFNNIANRDAVVTYTTNGAHKPDSYHYDGDAIDLRTRDLSAEDRRKAVEALRQELGSDYRVIDEGDHIHIEYRGAGGSGGSGGAGETGAKSPEGGDVDPNRLGTNDPLGGRK